MRGGIFLLVRFPNHSNQRSTVCLFHVADKVSQNYLSRASLMALFVVGPNFTKIGAVTSNTPRLFIPATQTQERCPGTRLGDLLTLAGSYLGGRLRLKVV